MNKYSLIPHLDELFFNNFRKQKAPNRENFLSWQNNKRKILTGLLSIEKLQIKKIQRISEQTRMGNMIALFEFYLSDGTVMPVYIAHARGINPPYRPIIIYHGHANGSQTLFGVGMTKEHQDYGLEFLRQGYLVIAPDQRGFVKRLGPSPINYNGYTRSCRQLAFNLLANGKTILGERVSDGLVLIDYLKDRKDVNMDKIVVTGNSGGGTVALLHAALDKRVSAAVVGSAFCEYKHSILELSHCECNYIPKLLQNFKEIWEVGALIAPRPLMIVHGRRDKIFPARYATESFKKLKSYYRLLSNKSADNLSLHIHPGSHWYDHEGVFNFLDSVYDSKFG